MPEWSRNNGKRGAGAKTNNYDPAAQSLKVWPKTFGQDPDQNSSNSDPQHLVCRRVCSFKNLRTYVSCDTGKDLKKVKKIK